MENAKKYDEIFMEAFEVGEEELGPDFSMDSREEWDSIGHMNLISMIEEEFDITLDDEDILALISYESGKNILRSKGIEL